MVFEWMQLDELWSWSSLELVKQGCEINKIRTMDARLVVNMGRDGVNCSGGRRVI